MRMHTPYHRGPLLLACTFAMLSVSVHAQQAPMYTMHPWSLLTVNPGYAGSADALNMTAIARRQWTGLDGAPATNAFITHTPLKAKALGMGLTVVDDKIGPSRTTSVYGDIAYRMRMGKDSRLALGLKAGFDLMRLDLSSVPGTAVDDPAFGQNDRSGPKPNFGFGIYYWSTKGYLGLSAPSLLGEGSEAGTDGSVLQLYKKETHFFLAGGYVVTLSDMVKLKPSFLMKAVVGAPVSIDLSAHFLFMERLWIGPNYRSSGDLGLMLGYRINDQLRVGYAYDLSITPRRTSLGGSHEIMLSYDLSFTERMLRSPRYF